MVHEHPGVYSSYDASSVIGGKKTARILGAAAVSTTGTANEVVTLTSYAEGVSAFGEDAERLLDVVEPRRIDLDVGT